MSTLSSPRRLRSRRERRFPLAHVGLILLAVTMLYPLIWMAGSSFKPLEHIFSDVSLIPRQLTLQNYIDGWSGLSVSFGRFFLNSVAVSGLTIVGNLLSCALTAFAFARLRFRGRGLLMGVMMLTIMLPIHVLLVPQYILFSELGWLNTYLPLVAPKFLATEAFFIFLMMQFMRSIPRTLDEAAMIDGCNTFQLFWRIVLPTIVPALATTAIFSFIWSWNEFFLPLIYLADPQMYTVPLGLRLYLDETAGAQWGSLFAMSMLSLIPVFLVFLFGQRLLIQGIATQGLK